MELVLCIDGVRADVLDCALVEVLQCWCYSDGLTIAMLQQGGLEEVLQCVSYVVGVKKKC